MMRHRVFFITVAILSVFAFSGSCATAAYTLTPLCNNSSAVQMQLGQSFLLDLDLTSDAGDMNDSAIFDLAFSSPGLVVNSYTWGGGYQTSGFDNSLPPHFENFILSDPPFGTGKLLTLDMTVPENYEPLNQPLSVQVLPGTFALGTATFVPAAGPDLEITIVPEPATLLLAVIGGFGLGFFSLRRMGKQGASQGMPAPLGETSGIKG